MKVLITGCAGFIGFHLCLKLLNKNNSVIGLDTLNNYYSKSLKLNRLKILQRNKKFSFKKIDISNFNSLKKVFKKNNFDLVINLAAYAGVEYSLINPSAYIKTNEMGFFNLLELSKNTKVPKIIFASSSSIYGENKLPFHEKQNTDCPISLYGATKKNNEILAYYYAKQFKINIIGIRFFTVFGPYGRPDLSIFKFCDQIINNKKITLNNRGNNYRDFTYIDDLIDSLDKIIYYKKNLNYQIFNISSGKKIKISTLVKILEKQLKKKAKCKYGKRISTDIKASLSYSKKLKNVIKFKTPVNFAIGIKHFVNWYKSYYNVGKN